MPPGSYNNNNDNYQATTTTATPMVPAMPASTYYGATTAPPSAETVTIDGETSPHYHYNNNDNNDTTTTTGASSPLMAVVVHNDEEEQRRERNGSNNNNANADNHVPVCRDWPFALLFVLHALIMAYLGLCTAPKGYDALADIDLADIEDKIRQGNTDTPDKDVKEFEEFIGAAAAYLQVYPLRILSYMVIPACLLAYLLGVVSTALVIKPFPRLAVYTCLVLSVVWVAAILIFTTIRASGSAFTFLFTGLALAASIYYVSIAWRMVPFASVNLKIALQGMGRNSGMYLVAFLFAELGFVWVLYWIYVVVGTSSYQNNQCKLRHPEGDFDIDSDNYDDSCDPSTLALIGLLLSLYWTNTVIMNTVQVTVAGVMATWCFDKTEADGCCSRAIGGSIYRSMTFSFGSICFGSLLQAIVSVFRYLVESARNQRNRDNGGACGAILLCILECLARLLEDILEYFNQWAFVFVGIYGYSYLESGRRVMELFRARGFTTIITDNLVGYVLAFTTFTVALLTGLAGMLVEKSVTASYAGELEDGESYIFGPLPAAGFAFGVSFIVGLWIVSVMMNVVKGAVNTLIVCWADSPATMEMQHPLLTKEMADAWSVVFSGHGPTTPAVIV